MVLDACLNMTSAQWDQIMRHLQPRAGDPEQAGFGYARIIEHHVPRCDMRLVDWQAITASAFQTQSVDYLELVDAVRGEVIKRAHDLRACLIEFHSHPLQSLAQFSWSDARGFADWVPHIQWRLPGRPYAAMVVARESFDSLIWNGAGARPSAYVTINADSRVMRPTGLSIGRWEHISDI